MWGQDSFISIEMTSFRIIPTRVGTSLDAGGRAYLPYDHPHACGDKSSLSFLAKEEQGSSPRVWGQANLDSLSADNIGIIPTRVGTSFGNVIIFVWKRDHPHACGDKYTFKSKELERTGSSPRVWGQVFDIFSAAIATGIIPTRVGTRTADYSSDALSRDHPHACGDKLS